MSLNQSGLCRSEIEKLIDEWIFHERNRYIVKRRVLDGKTYEQLAEEFELSTQQVKTIIYKCQNVLLRHI